MPKIGFTYTKYRVWRINPLKCLFRGFLVKIDVFGVLKPSDKVNHRKSMIFDFSQVNFCKTAKNALFWGLYVKVYKPQKRAFFKFCKNLLGKIENHNFSRLPLKGLKRQKRRFWPKTPKFGLLGGYVKLTLIGSWFSAFFDVFGKFKNARLLKRKKAKMAHRTPRKCS